VQFETNLFMTGRLDPEVESIGVGIVYLEGEPRAFTLKTETGVLKRDD